MLKLRACRFFHNCAWAYPVTPSGPPRREQGRPPAHETIRRAARPYAGRAGLAPSSSTKSHDPPARVPRWAAGGVRPLVSDRGARPGPPGVRGGRRAHHHRPVRARSTRHRRPAQRRHPHDAPRPPPAAPTATRPKASHTTRDASARQRHTHTRRAPLAAGWHFLVSWSPGDWCAANHSLPQLIRQVLLMSLSQWLAIWLAIMTWTDKK